MMKPVQVFSGLAVCGCGLCLLGCRKETPVDASRPLVQSFQASAPEVTQAIATVTTSLKAGNYLDAARALEPALAGRTLTPPQREAIGLAFQQISQAVAANPSLDSKELYELRVRMARAARGDRF
jgi:hypothetical protein